MCQQQLPVFPAGHHSISELVGFEKRDLTPGAVGTVMEIDDYLRLLFASVGTPYCYQCGREISQQTV